MRQFLRILRIAGLSFVVPVSLIAQQVKVGTRQSFAGNATPTGQETSIVGGPYRATLGGQASTATFGWSGGPCPAAVKIKFFRPTLSGETIVSYEFVAERGPFDVQAPVGPPPFGSPAVIQTVPLNPSVSLLRGDAIAITNLTDCGGPTYTSLPLGFPPSAPTAFVVPGDVTRSVDAQPFTKLAVFVLATGPSSELGLFGNRFAVSLTATNPRSLLTTIGVPLAISDGAGYFSLPIFTSDPSFPEVMVKIVNATGSPSLGGNFWFFHSSLTDFQYTVTVKDQLRGVTKTYTSTGPFCGGADTSAFPP
jgi:hypothetical protein